MSLCFSVPTHYGSLPHSAVPSLPSRDDTWNNDCSQPNPYRIPTTFSQPQKINHPNQTGRQTGKPILKFSQQDTIPECNEGRPPQNRPFYDTHDGKKKAVHFVRPYSSGRDQPQGELPGDDPQANYETNDLNKPGYTYCPSPQATHRLISGCGSGSGENFNMNNNNKVSNNIANVPEYAIPSHHQRECYRQKYPGQSKYFDIWRNSLDSSSRKDDDSQDGFSDGETTTSGSYCMDNSSISEDTVLTLENIHNKHIFV